MKISKSDASALFSDLLGMGEPTKTIEEIKPKKKVRSYLSKWRFVSAEVYTHCVRCSNCGTGHSTPNKHVLFKYERVRTNINHHLEDKVIDTHETYVPRSGVLLPADIVIEDVFSDEESVAYCECCNDSGKGLISTNELLKNLPAFISSEASPVPSKTDGFELTSLVKEDGSEEDDMSLMSADDILDYLESGGELNDEL